MVLAGNRQQFEDYLSENGLTDSEAHYIYDEHSFLGRGHVYEIVKYGTYYEHPHYHELLEMLENSQLK